MSRCQGNNLFASIVEEWIGSNKKGVDVVLVNVRGNCSEIALGAGVQHQKLAVEFASSRSQFR